MKPAGTRTGGKQRVRDLTVRRARAHQAPAPKRSGSEPSDATVCEGCGGVFRRKTWRQTPVRVTHALLTRAAWGLCPACRQVQEGAFQGRVVLRGSYLASHEQEIRRRIQNVAERAGYTQPERRLVAIIRRPGELNVLTTSQKLAHRIVHELKKAFKGHAEYAWSDRERRLQAVWSREEASEGGRAGAAVPA